MYDLQGIAARILNDLMLTSEKKKLIVYVCVCVCVCVDGGH